MAAADRAAVAAGEAEEVEEVEEPGDAPAASMRGSRHRRYCSPDCRCNHHSHSEAERIEVVGRAARNADHNAGTPRQEREAAGHSADKLSRYSSFHLGQRLRDDSVRRAANAGSVCSVDTVA